MVEPIQGEAGVIPATDEYLRGLRRLTAGRGILLIVDEIQTGMGRTGRLFPYQHAGIDPDVMTLGKGMGGGVPLAALAAKEGAAVFEPGEQGGTFNGNLLVTAAGCAVMEELTRPGFLDGVVATGDYLRTRLVALSAARGLGEVRGRGLLLAIDLGRERATGVVERALGEGLLLNAPRPDTLRFMPALTVSREEIDGMLAILERCV
jgi:acetylornithine/N-succinyldiaminopimelate aminotransferase